MLLACPKKRDREAIICTVRLETGRCSLCDCSPEPNPHVQERKAYSRGKRVRRRIGEVLPGMIAERDENSSKRS
jgi:hypothetical protein